jgi:hypothetical protein
MSAVVIDASVGLGADADASWWLASERARALVAALDVAKSIVEVREIATAR